ncbi:MAG: DUF3999 family protein [Lacunisphaera sp.]
MKRLLLRSRNPARRVVRPAWLLLLPFAVGATLHAALTPTEWSHRQSFTVAAPGLVRVTPTAASFDSAGPQQEDFRIVDPAGNEVAFLADSPPVPVDRILRPTSFSAKLETDATRLVIATGTKAPLASIALKTPAPFFVRAASVEISDDGEQWTLLDQGLPVFRQWGAEQLDLPLGGHTAAYVRVTINERHDSPLLFTGAELKIKAAPAPALVAVGAQIARHDEFAGETVLTLALEAQHIPLAAIELSASDPLFMRRVSVSVREVNGAVSRERVVGSGTIYRVALDGSPARSQLEIPLHFIPLTREVLVHVQNGDSPPLSVDHVVFKRRDLHLAFVAPTAGTYFLLSGNAQVSAPRYDLAAFADDLQAANATDVTPGAVEPMPGYHPRETLGSAAVPDVPLTGAPLDTTDWTQRKSITLTRAGIQELELAPIILANTRTDFADLRVLHDGNQIPYILEQPSLARALTVTPVSSPDPKRPSVSVWQLHLPQKGFPLRRLVFSSPTPLFQREFRIFEKITNDEGRAYELTLASAEWHRTPESGVPETRVVEIPDRTHTDTLWIETDNGDNPAIALGAVQLIYPVVRLIFKTDGTDGFTLAYGNPTANAPRYDLNLVATKLLTSPRNVATTGTSAAESSSSTKPFAGLNGGYVFWIALGLVVIVLLVVVAKLLPKPPAT